MDTLFETAAKGTQIVLVYSQPYIEHLSRLADPKSDHYVDLQDKITDAFIKDENGEVGYFPFTHSAEIDPNLTDLQAVEKALGNNMGQWGTLGLKLIRVSPHNVLSEGPRNTAPSQQKYYNFTEDTLLAPYDEIPSPSTWRVPVKATA